MCVAPDDPAYYDGIVISELTDFNSPTITQPAIAASAVSTNVLTSYDTAACSGAEWCTFSSILFADFFVLPGAFYGNGNANLEIKTSGRHIVQYYYLFSVRLSREFSMFQIFTSLWLKMCDVLYSRGRVNIPSCCSPNVAVRASVVLSAPKL